MNILAPIVLFVYNRPEHTIKTLDALKSNFIAKDSELFIYADAAKNESAQKQVEEVRELLSNVTGFKKVTVIKQEKNIGLANSIISGVTEIVNKYGKVIVLEDDLVTSPYFLNYMNNSLDFYKNNEKIWHIAGWNYPLFKDVDNDKAFLWRGMNCWGWATWDDKWVFYKKDSEFFLNEFTDKMINEFNVDGCFDFWEQMKRNHAGELNTWAIFWYASIFINNGLCLNPYQTFVHNIGNDGTGENCGSSDIYKAVLNTNSSIDYPSETIESRFVIKCLKKYFKLQKNILFRTYRKLKIFFL